MPCPASWPNSGTQPILYLHIGRNKCGSTSLQEAWVEHADHLRAHGIQYALFGQPNPPGRDFPTFPDHNPLRSYVAGLDAASVLVSHEGICCFEPEVVHYLATELADVGVRLIYYVRPYREWIVSSYNFDVRIGFNRLDFDAYFERAYAKLSMWPTLNTWAKAIGWENVRVRSLDPRDLEQGDLIADGFAALGVPAPARAMPADPASTRANVSASWMVTELLRTIDRDGASMIWSGADLALAQVLHRYVDEAASACGLSEDQAQYLSRANTARLVEDYNRDLAALRAETGIRLHYDDPDDPPERPFLPAARHIPSEVRGLVRRYALSDSAPAHPLLAAFVDGPLFRG